MCSRLYIKVGRCGSTFYTQSPETEGAAPLDGARLFMLLQGDGAQLRRSSLLPSNTGLTTASVLGILTQKYNKVDADCYCTIVCTGFTNSRPACLSCPPKVHPLLLIVPLSSSPPSIDAEVSVPASGLSSHEPMQHAELECVQIVSVAVGFAVRGECASYVANCAEKVVS